MNLFKDKTTILVLILFIVVLLGVLLQVRTEPNQTVSQAGQPFSERHPALEEAGQALRGNVPDFLRYTEGIVVSSGDTETILYIHEDPHNVFSWYESQLTQAGWEILSESDQGEFPLFISAGNGAETVSVTVEHTQDDDDPSKVTINYQP